MTASVKVMRSFDYCHFEICLGSEVADLEAVDELRKSAARLADKAVAQYQIAKANAAHREDDERLQGYREQECERIRKTPEGDRTVREQATLKEYDDRKWQESREYDYEDQWEDGQ